MAAWLTEPGLARRGPSSFRASAGCVCASILASMIAAWSVETNTVGLSISDLSICSPGPGEQMLRSLMDNPTVFVSTDQAAIMLARMLAHTQPAEARKLLGPLRAKPGSVSQAAIQAYGELPPQ